jgi:regulatory protein
VRCSFWRSANTASSSCAASCSRTPGSRTADAREALRSDTGAASDPVPALPAGAGRDALAARAAIAANPGQVDALLDELAASGISSEARFVETRSGPRRARQPAHRQNSRHGLQLSADAAQAENKQYARAKAVWLRKFGGPARDAAGRARQMRFLAARGVSPVVVRRLLRGADDDS